MKKCIHYLGNADDILLKKIMAMGSEGLESFHKLIKRFRDRLSRKTNLSDNLHDILIVVCKIV
jgi:hypothetical protein